MKKVACSVCESEIKPKRSYTAVQQSIFCTLYDAMDCTECGCQIILKERCREYAKEEFAKEKVKKGKKK